MDLNIRIAGEAGQGVQTTGSLLVAALARAGMHVFASQSYMSRIRGGLNWYDVRIADCELFGGRVKADLLVALTDQALTALSPQVAEGGLAIRDAEGSDGAAALPLSKTAKEIGGSEVMANTVAAGAVFRVLGYDLAPLCDYLQVQFAKKGQEVIEGNIRCARRGAELAAPLAGKLPAPPPGETPDEFYSGGEAVGLAAATAGVKFVAAYPMTPSTAVLTYLAKAADEYGILVEQAEDEIAAVNMICGATYAGVPAMATTSGGGFALMTEGVSLAGMMELPIVILLSQRPGPATGLPTRTAQQDLLFVLHAGHGEFPRAIFAPGTARQAYDLTRRALETAHRFQTPAFILTDQFLVDCQKNMPALDASLRPIDRCILRKPPGDHVRYGPSDGGVSPRAIPGEGAMVVCDSDEHTEDGHITEDLAAAVRLQDKRRSKAAGLLAEAMRPELYGPADAGELLVCWGSTYGPCREAVDLLNAAGRSAAMLHFAQLWPIDGDHVRSLLAGADGGRRPVTFVEGNATGQLAMLLRQCGVCPDARLIGRCDGLPFTAGEIVERVKQ